MLGCVREVTERESEGRLIWAKRRCSLRVEGYGGYGGLRGTIRGYGGLWVTTGSSGGLWGLRGAPGDYGGLLPGMGVGITVLV